MCEVAGEVGDGLICHPMATPGYIDEVMRPALDRGAGRAGRDRGDVELIAAPLIATGESPAEIDAAAAAVRMRIAFYASTPAYQPALAVHGRDWLQPKLNAMSKRGEWTEMASLIDDDMLHAFAVVGTPREVARTLIDRFGERVRRLSLPAHASATVLAQLTAELAALQERRPHPGT
jgi:alkanesulfonate monooxygenase SsuD/methylene tetrahydromethanopterin reductase-like flavin-dependent oxidoreductase (luciferase family)